MPQTSLEYIYGYLRLTFDTLTQRLRLPPTPGHPVFTSSHHLEQQTIVITGANTGIGYETTRQLARTGASIILACRNRSRAESAISALKSENHDAKLEYGQLDLGDTASIRQFAEWIRERVGERGVDCLILNGGVMGMERKVPETHFMVNHVGHALLSLLLLPITKRLVFITSLACLLSDLRLFDISFTGRYYNWMTAYANSKLAMILFMHALRKRVDHVEIYGVHPGEVTSDVARNLGTFWMTLHKNVGQLFLLNVEQSARTSVYVAGLEKGEGIEGAVYERVCEVAHIPETLLDDKDVEQLWKVTLDLAGVTDEDLRQYLPNHDLAKP